MVSIIIPCFNAERWLAETLRSALAQSGINREIILVDDGSTDQSREIAAQFTAQGVHVIDQANRGASAARNAGLRAAKGKWIQFLDADDLLGPEKLARQVAALERAGEDVLAAGPWGRFTKDP